MRPTRSTLGWRTSRRTSSDPTYPVAPMIPTRIRRTPSAPTVPRSDRGANPGGRSVAIAAGDSSPALTGARSPSREADSGGSQRSEGPTPWAHDYTASVHSHARVTAAGVGFLGPRPPEVWPDAVVSGR